MTGAELRTLRDSLGLSADQLAQMLGNRDRTIRRWESGEWPVPDDAAEVLQRLDAQVERAVQGAVDALQDAKRRTRKPPADAVLVRYRTDRDLAYYRPDMAAWPLCVHGALIDRVRLAFSRLGVTTRIVWMDDEAYSDWLAGRIDSEPLRAAWAAEQIGKA